MQDHHKPLVIMLCGVNGNGKTTTAGKLAMQFKNQGMSVMLGACDTFRAAAVEQLQAWGDKIACEVVTGDQNSDPASVGYKALLKAKEQQIDILILDTAGRLHNKSDLMNELQKCVRVIKKIDQDTPHEIIMVLDSTTGQNAYNQISTFKEIVPITGLIFTKLDSSAKGGIIVGAAKCATTALLSFIAAHPNVVGDGYKEIYYFSSDRNYRKGTEWYREQMPYSNENQINAYYSNENEIYKLKNHSEAIIIINNLPVNNIYTFQLSIHDGKQWSINSKPSSPVSLEIGMKIKEKIEDEIGKISWEQTGKFKNHYISKYTMRIWSDSDEKSQDFIIHENISQNIRN